MLASATLLVPRIAFLAAAIRPALPASVDSLLLMAHAEDVWLLAPTAAPPTSLSALLVLLDSPSSAQPAFLAQKSVRHAAQESAQLAFQDIHPIQMEFVYLPVRYHAPPVLIINQLSVSLATVEPISMNPLVF